MDTTSSKVLPAPPSLIKSFTAGFDAISNHVGLILFPVALDLLLWLGPHLRMARLIQSFFDQATAQPESGTPEMANMIRTSRELWMLLAERFNLLDMLRSYPVGIPSLMVSRAPLAAPGGMPLVWELPSLGESVLLWLFLTIAGLVAGALYFEVVAQAATSGKMSWRLALRRWPRASVQVLFLALFWLALFLAAVFPFTCILTFFFASGLGLSQLVVLLFGAVLVWLLLPLIFSPHGIFVKGRGMWASVRDGVRLTRLTLPSTGLLFLIILILSEGLDVLWRIPAETSWLSFIGVVGHAFVATGLLAASFVYYRDADLWVQKIRLQVKSA